MFFKWKMLRVRAVCSATPTYLDCTGDLVAGELIRNSRDILETSALHPSTPDESSSMNSACPA